MSRKLTSASWDDSDEMRITIEIGKREKQILATAIGLTVAMLASLSLADVPKTFSSGELLLASDLNENFVAIDQRIAMIEGQINGVNTALSTGCDAKSAISSVADGVAECVPSNDIVGIVANLTGSNGGSALASCPDGYSLVATSIFQDQRTQSGTSGWNNGGTVSCGLVDGQLSANLLNYESGSINTVVSCYGICVRTSLGK
jgi:hypothetical protein